MSGAAKWRLIVPALLGVAITGTALAPRANAYVYWTETHLSATGGTIARANFDATGLDRSFVKAGFNDRGFLAVDPKHIYWSDYSDIARGNLSGRGLADPHFVQAGNAGSLAVDSQHIYWTSKPDFAAGSNSIGRANIDGTGIKPDFISSSGGSVIADVAVDAKYIYWVHTRTSDLTTSIGRANLNGTNVDQSFIPDVAENNPDFYGGIAVGAGRIYWISNNPSTGSGAIGRANTDGTGVNKQFISLGCSGGWDVTVDPGHDLHKGHVYWTANNGCPVGRANLDGSGVDENFIPFPSNDYGQSITVDPFNAEFRFACGACRIVHIPPGGHGVLPVTIHGPGKLTLLGDEVKRVTRTVSLSSAATKEAARKARGRRVKLPVKPRRKARRALRRHGKVKVKVKVRYKAPGSRPVAKSRRIKLVASR